MAFQIIKEVTAMKDTSEVTIKQVLAFMWRVEVQTSQKAMLATIQEREEFYMVRLLKNTDCETIKQKSPKEWENATTVAPSKSQDNAQPTKNTNCGKLNHFKQVC